MGAGDGPSRRFDAAVVLIHPDQALLLLDEPGLAERAVWARSRIPCAPGCTDGWSCPATSRPRILELVTPGQHRVVVATTSAG